MQELKSFIPELKYMKMHLNPEERIDYVKASKPALIQMLWQINLNIFYANKSGMPLSKSQIHQLMPFKALMKKIIAAKTVATRKKLMSKNLVDCILEVFLSVVSSVKLEY